MSRIGFTLFLIKSAKSPDADFDLFKLICVKSILNNLLELTRLVAGVVVPPGRTRAALVGIRAEAEEAAGLGLLVLAAPLRAECATVAPGWGSVTGTLDPRPAENFTSQPA